jgi:hypothetical protein
MQSHIHMALDTERAGHSVDVLLKVYAKCIDGQTARVNGRIDVAGRDWTSCGRRPWSVVRNMLSRAHFAPSRSWTLAATTLTTISSPNFENFSTFRPAAHHEMSTTTLFDQRISWSQAMKLVRERDQTATAYSS